MPQDQLLRSQAAAPLAPTSNHHEDDALAPPHPYPGWQPTGAGDPNALLAWIDHDLKGHDAVLDAPPRPLRGEPEKPEFAKPARTAKAVVEDVERAKHVAEGAEWLEHGALHTASRALAPVLGPLGIMGGSMEIAEGVDKTRDGNGRDGWVDIVSGILGIGSSGAGMAHLISKAALRPALALGAAADGLKFGHYGDEQVKKLGWLRGENGAQSASEWAGSEARRVREWFAERGHPIVGDVLGFGSWFGTSAAGAGVALAGAGTSIGRGLAHRRNVHRWLGYDGMDLSRDTAEGLANYEEQRQAAIERSKREHPERWGHNPHNPSYSQAFDHLVQLASGEGDKK